MRSVLLVGGVGAGKTTFRQQLQHQQLTYAKTQTIEWCGGVIDSPGEYLELGRYKRALLVASYDVDAVVLMQPADQDACRIPPGFASGFTADVVGVVSKCDLGTPEQIQAAIHHLESAGAHPVVCVDSLTGAGFDRVREVL